MGSYTAHTESRGGFTLRIIQDDDGSTDQPYADDEGTLIVIAHNRYVNPADKAGLRTPGDVAVFLRNRAAVKDPWDEFPLYMYDHSGTVYRVSMQGNPFSCPWDSGRIGSILLRRSEWSCKRGKGSYEIQRLRYAESVAKQYSDWANSNIWGYQIVEDDENDVVESCWGFIGDWDGDSGVLDVARAELASYVDANADMQRFYDLVMQSGIGP